MGLERRCLVFIFFILINIGQISAQSVETPKTEKPVKVGTGFGYSFLGYREETDLPINRELDTFNFNIDANIEKNNFLYSLNFGFLKGESDPVNYYSRGATDFKIFFENALDYRLWGNGIFPGYLGGAIRGDLFYSSLKQSRYFSLTMLFSLDLHATQKWIINDKNELIFTASIPFFGYAFRPPYYGLLYAPLDLDERITSFHNYQAIFGDLKYYYQINQLLNIYLGLGFGLSRVTFPQPRKDALFCINAGITFSF